jgi:NADH:ubiquinone oxidoreductase subunit 6 (subunit J)
MIAVTDGKGVIPADAQAVAFSFSGDASLVSSLGTGPAEVESLWLTSSSGGAVEISAESVSVSQLLSLVGAVSVNGIRLVTGVELEFREESGSPRLAVEAGETVVPKRIVAVIEGEKVTVVTGFATKAYCEEWAAKGEAGTPEQLEFTCEGGEGARRLGSGFSLAVGRSDGPGGNKLWIIGVVVGVVVVVAVIVVVVVLLLKKRNDDAAWDAPPAV